MHAGITWRLLVDAARTAVGHAPAGAIRIADANWVEILWHSRVQRLAPHVLELLEQQQHEIPDDVRGALALVRRAVALRRLVHAAEAVRVGSTLRSHSIPALLINRWALSQRHHARPELAPPGKRADWLVPLGHLDEAMRVLRDAGIATSDASPLALTHFGAPRVTVSEADAEHFERADQLRVGSESVSIPAPQDWLALRRVRMSLATAVDTVVLARAAESAAGRSNSGAVDDMIAASVELIGAEWSQLSRVPANATPGSAELVRACLSLGTDEETPIVPASSPSESLGAFAPTPMPVVDAMLRLARVGPDDTVYDLGCGDGRIVVRAAAEFGARAVGVDNDAARISQAQAAAVAAGVTDRVAFVHSDASTHDLTGASVVCLYLQGFAYERMEQSLRSTLKPGSRIVSHTVAFRGWLPSRIAVAATPNGHAAYVYVWEV